MADKPLEVVIARRRRSRSEKVLPWICLACYLVAVKVFEDVQTGSWQHSRLRLGALGIRDRAAAVMADVQETARFRAAVRHTLDQLDTIDIDTTEEVES